MVEEAEQIRGRMAALRASLSGDVPDAVAHAKQVTDWRYLVAQHPISTLAATAAVGFLFVPKRLQMSSPDAETLEKLAKRNRLVVKPKAEVKKSAGVVSPLLNLLAGAVIRSAITMAGQRLSAAFEQSSANDRRESL